MAPPALGFAFSWHTHEPWSPLSTPPGGGRNMAGLVRDAEGALLILGGSDEHGVPLSTVSRWQPHDSPSSPSNTGTWSIGPDMRVERCCCGAAVDGTGCDLVSCSYSSSCPAPAEAEEGEGCWRRSEHI